MSNEDIRNIVEILEGEGYELELSGHGNSKCYRCGNEHGDCWIGIEEGHVCYVCFHWEEPTSTDAELYDSAISAFQNGITLDMWLAGRRNWGKLIPTDEQVKRIKKAMQKFMDDVWDWAKHSEGETNDSG